MYSSLVGAGLTRAEIARKLCDRCNELGRMEIDESGKAVENPNAEVKMLKSAV